VALSRSERWLLVLATGVIWLVTREGMLLLVLLVAAGRVLLETASEESDRGALALYVFLLASLAWIATSVPVELVSAATR
jgi:hypothetical protein